METGYIYMIKNKKSDKKYIGQTCNPIRRWAEHKYKNNLAIQKAIDKYGSDHFKLQIIEENVKQENLNNREKYWINFYNTYKGVGYNLCEGGSNFYNRTLTQEHRDKIGDAHRGKTLSKETRKKLSLAKKGRKLRNSTIKKLEKFFSSPKHPSNKLSKKDYISIHKKYYKNNKRQDELAAEYDIDRTQIGRIVRGEHWATKDLSCNSKDKWVKENHPQSISVDKAKKIIKEYKNTNKTQEEVAEKLNVGQTVVCNVINGNHWTSDYL